MTLQTLSPQMHLIFEAIDALVTATKDEKADLRFADWDEAEITPTSVGIVVKTRLEALRAEYARNELIHGIWQCMDHCSFAALRHIQEGDHESAGRAARRAAQYADRYMRLVGGAQ